MKFPKHNIDIFYLILFVSLFVINIYGRIMLASKAISLPFLCIGAVADASLLTALSMLLRGRWRLLALLFLIATCILIIVNILYYRNFGDLLPGSGYSLDSAFDSRILEAARHSFTYSLLIPIACLFPPAIYIFHSARQIFNQKISKPFAITILAVTISFWGLTYIGSYRRMGIYLKENKFALLSDELFTTHSTNWMFYLENHNFTGYWIRCLLSNPGIELSPENITEIKETFSAKSTGRSEIALHPRENLIVIVVESLSSKVIELKNCKAIIPNLHELINDSTTITLTDCKVLAGPGRSSDAQFMYNTGLLPLKSEALVSDFASNAYPSLAKALNKKSIEIIGESKRLWNHAVTSQSYGFSELIDNIADNTIDQDSIILGYAANRIKSLHSPFYLFTSTLSMHDPYDSPKVRRSKIDFNCIDNRDQEYFQRLYHFDKSLGRFIDELKQHGKFDNSLIIIIGDHEIRRGMVPSYLEDNRVPFIIVNGGVSPEKIRNRKISQIDIFPTILDLLKIDYKYLDTKYTGLGKSIFSHGGNVANPTKRDYEISEMIIRGNIGDFL